MTIVVEEFASTSYAAFVPVQNQAGQTSFKRSKPQLDKVLVAQFGSKNLYIGRKEDSLPFAVLNVLARPSYQRSVPGQTQLDLEEFRDAAEAFQKSRIQLVPNPSHQNVEESLIADHNDTDLIVWTEPQKPEIYFGKEALQLTSYDEYEVKWPFQCGRQAYSGELWRSDVEAILLNSLRSKLDILTPEQVKEHGLVLVVPDIVHLPTYQDLYDLMSRLFGAVTVMQESVAATFGAGIGTACVVNVGSSGYSVACVDEGVVVPKSKIYVEGVGGDLVTDVLVQLLDVKLPSTPLELDQLKHKVCGFQDEDVKGSYDTEFIHRHPGQPTRRLRFKLYQEGYYAPLVYMYPYLLFSDNEQDFINQGELPDYQDNVGGSLRSAGWYLTTSDLILSTSGSSLTLSKSKFKKHHLLKEPILLVTKKKAAPSGPTAPIDGPITEPGEDVPDGQTQTSAKTQEQDQSQTQIPDQEQDQTKTEDQDLDQSQTNEQDPMDVDEPTAEVFELESLDTSIVLSILSCAPSLMKSAKKGQPVLSGVEEQRLKSLLSQIVVTGGGYAQFRNYDRVLQDVVYDSLHSEIAPKLNLSTVLNMDANVLPPPHDINPQYLCWKGAAVWSQLESFEWTPPSFK